jgi:hypothetical protein
MSFVFVISESLRPIRAGEVSRLLGWCKNQRNCVPLSAKSATTQHKSGMGRVESLERSQFGAASAVKAAISDLELTWQTLAHAGVCGSRNKKDWKPRRHVTNFRSFGMVLSCTHGEIHRICS